MTNPPRLRPLRPVAPPAASDPADGSSARIHLGRVFKAESASYFLLLGTTLFLVVFGLVMVLSSSSVDSYLENSGFFGTVLRQGGFALIGVPLLLVVSRLPLVTSTTSTRSPGSSPAASIRVRSIVTEPT